MAFPRNHWTRIRTKNALERMNREIRRRTRVVGNFPDGRSALMLVSARLRNVAATQWGSRRYLDMDKLQNQNPRKEALEVVGAGKALIIQNDPDFTGSQNKCAQLDRRDQQTRTDIGFLHGKSIIHPASTHKIVGRTDFLTASSIFLLGRLRSLILAKATSQEKSVLFRTL